MATIITKRANGSIRVQHMPEGESLTRQSEAAKTDINNIMKKYKRDGVLTHVRNSIGEYLDVSNISDLSSAIDVVKRARESFDSYPSDLRAKFDNNPIKMIDFLKDSKNDEEAIKLGLKKKPASIPTETPLTGGQENKPAAGTS